MVSLSREIKTESSATFVNKAIFLRSESSSDALI